MTAPDWPADEYRPTFDEIVAGAQVGNLYAPWPWADITSPEPIDPLEGNRYDQSADDFIDD